MSFESNNNRQKKICSVEELMPLVDKYEDSVRGMGLAFYFALVTGCFDVLHIGQIEFLRQAKRISRVLGKNGREHILDYGIDILAVGVDPDETVRLKGPGRPVFGLQARLEVLAELESVDLVFPLPFILKKYSASEENALLFEQLTRKIAPNVLVANELTDPFYEEKMGRAFKLGIAYVGLKVARPTSSTEVVNKIQRL
jgi:bifunctional ADP-heptose synthase (sugar kinase/adenylyltransferase)